MRITRSLSIDIETWEAANKAARVENMTFSAFVERAINYALAGPDKVAQETIPLTGPVHPGFLEPAPVTIVDLGTKDIVLMPHPTDGIGMSQPAPKPVAKPRSRR